MFDRFRFAVILTALTLSSPALLADEEKDSVELMDKVQEVRQDLVKGDLKQREVMRSVYGIHQKIERISKEKGILTDRMMLLNSEAKGLAKNIVELEKRRDLQKSKMNRRLRALYKLSGQSVLRLLFSSNSGDRERNLRFLSMIVEKDHQAIKDYQKSVLQFQKKKGRLQKKVKQIVGVRTKIKAKEDHLLGEQRRKIRLVDQMKKKREQQISEMRNLRSRAPGETLGESDQAGQWHFFEKKGQLPPPTEAPLFRGFGVVEGFQPEVWLSQKGHLYRKTEDRRVFAVDHGKVAFSGVIDGFNHVVILDHGDNYYSIYGHLQASSLEIGEEIDRGDTFAKIKGSSTQPEAGLYFEIRHFSQPEDPQQWLAEEELKVSSVE